MALPPGGPGGPGQVGVGAGGACACIFVGGAHLAAVSRDAITVAKAVTAGYDAADTPVADGDGVGEVTRGAAGATMQQACEDVDLSKNTFWDVHFI